MIHLGQSICDIMAAWNLAARARFHFYVGALRILPPAQRGRGLRGRANNCV